MFLRCREIVEVVGGSNCRLMDRFQKQIVRNSKITFKNNQILNIKVDLIPESEGRSITYALGPIRFKTLNGPALQAHNFLVVP